MWEIAVVVAVVVFAITCFFIIQTLIAFQRSLQSIQIQTEKLTEESGVVLRLVGNRINALDSTFRTVSNLGDICEAKTVHLKESYFHKPNFREQSLNVGEEVVNWALTSARLYQQIFKNKG